MIHLWKRWTQRLLAGALLGSQIGGPTVIAYAQETSQLETKVTQPSKSQGDSSEGAGSSSSKENFYQEGDEVVAMPKLEKSAKPDVEVAKATDKKLPKQVAGNKIERFDIQWRTQDNDSDKNTLNNVWLTDDPQTVSYVINYALSGQKGYQPGDITIRLPKSIFKDRNGNPIGQMTFGVPKSPDKNGVFAWAETDDHYVITNVKKLPATTSGFIEGSIRELEPCLVKDKATGYKTDPLFGTLQVITHSTEQMGAETEKLWATADTSATLYGAYLRHNKTVYNKYPDDWDQRLKPDHPEDYYYATFTSYAHSQANQYYRVKATIDARTTSDAKNAIVLGVHNHRTDEVLKGDGRGTFERDLETNVYLKDGDNFSNTIYVAYPKNDFRTSRKYQMGVDITYTMTAEDDHNVTSDKASAVLPFSPVISEYPSGSFYVEKQGDGDHREWVDDTHREGIYDTALNRLRAGQDVEVKYDLETRARAGQYTLKEGGDPTNLLDYGKRSYKLITEDYKTTLDGVDQDLSKEDVVLKALDLSRVPTALEFTALDNKDAVYNPLVGREFTAGNNKPLFGYKNADVSKIPVIHIFAKKDNQGDYFEVGSVDYTSGQAVIHAQNGATVKGSQLVFPSDVTDYKTEAETTLAGYSHDVWLYATVKPSDHVKKTIDSLYEQTTVPMTYLANHAKLNVVTSDGKGFVNEYIGRNQLQGFAAGMKPEEKLVNYDNDVVHRKVTLTYELKNTLQTNLQSKEAVDQAIKDGWLHEQKESTFYNLLPAGATPVTSSVRATREGDNVSFVKAHENWKGTGRVLLEIHMTHTPDYKYQYRWRSSILKTRGYYDTPAVRFEARYPWLNLETFGRSLESIMAYKTNVEVTTTRGIMTETDVNSGRNDYTRLAFHTDEEKESFKDLKGNLTFARADSYLSVDTSGQTQLLTQVDVNKESLWNDGLDDHLAKNVYEGGWYDYQLSVKNPSTNKSKDMIFYDNLEAFTPQKEHDDYKDVTWKGSLRSVNIDGLKKLGIEPVVYYSTRKGLVLDDSDHRKDNDLSDSSIWSTTAPDDLSKVTAIAVDLRKKADGSDFVLGASETVGFTLSMQAPDHVSHSWYDQELNGQKERGLTGGAHAYNNSVLTSRSIAMDTGATSENLLIRNDYTKVGLKPYEIAVHKTFDDDNNRDGKRKDVVELELLADGKPTGKTVRLTKENDWYGTFGHVPYINRSGEVITYTLREKDADGYVLKIIDRKDRRQIEEDLATKGLLTSEDALRDHPLQNATQLFEVQNVHVPEKVHIKGEKTWKDESDYKRPKSLTILLKADGQVIREFNVTPNSDGKWLYDFGELYRYRDGGHEIKYEVYEKDYVTGYVNQIHGFNIENTWHPYGTVKIKKTIANEPDRKKGFWERFKKKAFTFRLTIRDQDNHLISQTYAYETSKGRTGRLTSGSEFTLEKDEELTLKDVDSEQIIHVDEVGQLEGYSLGEIKNNDVLLQAGKTETIEVVNTYHAKGQAKLTYNKVLKGRAILPNDFSFELIDVQANKVVATAPCDTDGHIAFYVDYTYDDRHSDVGTHEYVVREQKGNRGGVTYDTAEKGVTVSVSHGALGQLDTSVQYAHGDKTFTNIYKASGQVHLKAWKQMKNGDTAKAKAYTFELLKGNEVVARGQNDAFGTVHFSPLHFTEQDIGKTYHYEAREVKGDDDAVIYDQTRVGFTVEVFDNKDGTLSFNTDAKDLYTGDVNNDKNTPLFVNALKDGKLTIQKKIQGDPSSETFKFKVKIKGSEMPDGNLEVKRHTLSERSGDAEAEPHDTSERSLTQKLFDLVAPIKAHAAEVKPPYKEGAKALTMDATPATEKASVTETKPPYKERAKDESLDAISRPQGRVIAQGTAGGDNGLRYTLYENGHMVVMPVRFSGIINTDNINIWRDLYSILKKTKYISISEDIKVINGSYLFAEFNKVEKIETQHINTFYALNLRFMFKNCSSLKSLDVSGFDTSNVTSLWGMFQGCSHLKSLDVSNFRTSKVNDFASMFQSCSSLESLDVSGFDTSHAEADLVSFLMTDELGRRRGAFSNMFDGCTNLTYLDVSNFDTSRATYFNSMFDGCTALKKLDVSKFKTSGVTDFSFMFNNCASLTTLDVSGFVTSRSKNFDKMFAYCRNLKALDVSRFDTSRSISFSSMFQGCTNLETLDVSGFDTSHATNLSNMFQWCPALKTIDVSGFDTSHATNLSNMFQGCIEVEELDISGFDTSHVTRLLNVFDLCVKIKKVIGLSDKNKKLLSKLPPNFYTLPGDIIKYIKDWTGKWYREDKRYGPYLPQELEYAWQSDMAGTWIREKMSTKYTLTFDTNGTGEELVPMEVDKDTAVTLPKPKIQPLGKKFKAWKLPDGTEQEAGSQVKALGESGQTIKLTAVWTELPHSVTVHNNEFEVDVSGNEQATIEGLPGGASYEIYEQTKKGWVLVNEVNTTGTIPANGEAVASFTNAFKPDAVQAKIVAKKYLDQQPKAGFTFQLLKDGQVVDEASSTHDGQIAFKSLVFDHVGTYTYQVKEKPSNNPAVADDSTVHTVNVEVKNVDGSLQARVDKTPDQLVFYNTTKIGQLHVVKNVVGTSAKDKDFTFVVTLNGKEQTISLKNGEEKVFDLPYGTSYTVKEKDLPDGYQLDAIEHAEGTIDQPSQTVKVKNTYTAKGTLHLEAKKILKGRELRDGEFTFELKRLKAGQPKNQAVVCAKSHNDQKGRIVFDDIPLDNEGHYQYLLTEIDRSDPRITYDTHEPVWEVYVRDDGEGRLMVDEAQSNVKTIPEMVNTYNPPQPPHEVKTKDITITKRVDGIHTGKPFLLKAWLASSTVNDQEAGARYMVISDKGNPVQYVTLGKDAKQAASLMIHQDETLTLNGLPEKAELHFKEENAGSGWRTTAEEWATKDHIEFTNIYEAHGQLQLTGRKRLIGGSLKNYRFNFLVLQDGNIVSRGQNNGSDITFDPIYYTQRDIGKTYTYTVVEDGGRDETMHYDETEHTVTVKISDKGDGTLRIDADYQPLTFINWVSPVLPVTGTLLTGFVFLGLIGVVVARKWYDRLK